MGKIITVTLQRAYEGYPTDRRVWLNEDDLKRRGIGENSLAIVDPTGLKIACIATGSDKVNPDQAIIPKWLKLALAKRTGSRLSIDAAGTPIPDAKDVTLQIVSIDPTDLDVSDRQLHYLVRSMFQARVGLNALLTSEETFELYSKEALRTFSCQMTMNEDGPRLLCKDTKVSVKKDKVTLALGNPNDVPWGAIGGLEPQIALLHRWVELPFRHPELFRHLGIEPPKGILIKGSPGCGKTMLARALAGACHARLIDVAGSSVTGKYFGEAEGKVEGLFEEARKNQPSIILLDDIDGLLASRDGDESPMEGRVLADFLACMDRIKPWEKIVVIGTTNHPGKIDAALRRPGRFDHELLVPVPDENARAKIFQKYLDSVPENAKAGSDIDVAELAALARGFSGADIMTAVRNAAFKAIDRNEALVEATRSALTSDQLDQITITRQDLLDATLATKPSSLRGMEIEIPRVSWDDIGGFAEQKHLVAESVSWMTTKRDPAKAMGVHLPKGILLHGPPGTGKTLIGKAIATEGKCNFIAVRGPELLSKFMGESEENMRSVFQLARMALPCVIFFDEFDAIAASRSGAANDSSGGRAMNSLVAQLLAEMDGLLANDGVIIVASTNRPDIIDPAVLRSGRIDRIIEIPAPDAPGRAEIFKVHLRGKALDADVRLDAVAEELASNTDGFSGADIEAVVMEAGINALRRDAGAIGVGDIDMAMKSAIATRRVAQCIKARD